jgi:acyl-CoA synthetase (AMP-forming)/AMP-acid ligase II
VAQSDAGYSTASERAGRRGDERWATTGHLIAEAAAEHPDRVAIVDTDQSLSYSDLLTESRRAAGAFLAAGIEVGDRVAIWAPNTWRWIAAALGAQTTGAAIVPLNTRYRGAEAAYILNRAVPRVLVIDDGFLGHDYLGMLAAEGIGQETVPTTVVLGETTHRIGLVTWKEFLEKAENESAVERRLDSLDGSRISDVLFTSGTTGRPKGVLTTHAQNLRAYYEWSTLAGFQPGERYAIVNPFFHAFGYKAGWLSALMHGNTIYPHATLDASALLDQVERERIHVLPGPPTLYATVLSDPRLAQRDLSSLRLAITGAASIPPILIRRLFADLGFERVTTCYGLTESTGIATISRQEDDVEILAAASGRPFPDVEVVVVDEDGRSVAPGELGEVWIRGFNLMQGYFNAPEETVKRIDAEGWLHTGDIARMDQRGNVSVVDRKGDMFIVGGFNAYPAEIEAMLAEHPDIREVAVVGVPDERLGEVGVAFVVPSASRTPGEDELVGWARQRMANFKVPRRVWIVDGLPRNATGKVLKGDLRANARDRESGAVRSGLNG